MNTRYQKIALNLLLLFSIGFIEFGCIYLILHIKPQNFYVATTVTEHLDFPEKYRTLNPEAFTFIALSLIIAWVGIMIGFYAWAIYYYNINLGKTNEEWAEIKRQKATNNNLKQINPELVGDDCGDSADNPYKDETFGLPPGTVRGTIALSMLIGGFALLILSQNIVLYKNTDALEKYLEYFKTAFMMMIAFYFGSQSLKYFRNPSQTPASSSGPDTSSPPVPQSVPEELVATLPGPTMGRVNSLFGGTVQDKAVQLAVAKNTQAEQGQKKITDEEIEKYGTANKIEPELIKAVMTVESSGGGFLQDGRPKILFEGHIFWRELIKAGKKPEQYAAANPDILYPVWTTKYYSKIPANEYLRLDRAIQIDKDSALKSASWGLFQLMGFNYDKAGFANVTSFVEAQKASELNQLDSFFKFIQAGGQLQFLKDHKWEDFARSYNGKDFKKNNYDVKIEDAYFKFLHEKTPVTKAELKRQPSGEKETLGELTVINADRNVFTCKTLELPWKNNDVNISCIPAGTYQVKKRCNEKHGNHFQVLDVPNRSYILIHSGNYFSEVRGCILVGKEHQDINNDHIMDVTQSKITLELLNGMLPDQFELTIS